MVYIQNENDYESSVLVPAQTLLSTAYCPVIGRADLPECGGGGPICGGTRTRFPTYAGKGVERGCMQRGTYKTVNPIQQFKNGMNYSILFLGHFQKHGSAPLAPLYYYYIIYIIVLFVRDVT